MADKKYVLISTHVPKGFKLDLPKGCEGIMLVFNSLKELRAYDGKSQYIEISETKEEDNG